MVFVEKWPCETKREALAREQYWIEILKPNMNTYMAQRSYQQWCEDNKEHIQEVRKKHYEANKSKKIAYQNEYNKEYRLKNKDKIIEYKKEYNKEYRLNNKDTIKEKAERPFKCDCGATVRWDYRTAHCKTQLHIKRLGQLKLLE